MKKKIFLRGLLGLPVGIAIGFVVSLFISICIGDGSFHPVAPEFIQTMGNELNAVILQTKRRILFGYQRGHVTDCLFCELDEALHYRCPFLCGNFRDDFCGGLDFTVSALEEAHQKNERTNSRRG